MHKKEDILTKRKHPYLNVCTNDENNIIYIINT